MMKTTQQVEALFDAARQLLNPAARRVFLDEACADDASLRTRVEALLAVEAEANKFFSDIAPLSCAPLSVSEHPVIEATRFCASKKTAPRRTRPDC